MVDIDFSEVMRRKMVLKKKREPKQVVPPPITHDQATFGGPARLRKYRTPKEVYDEACRASDDYDLKKAKERKQRYGG